MKIVSKIKVWPPISQVFAVTSSSVQKKPVFNEERHWKAREYEKIMEMTRARECLLEKRLKELEEARRPLVYRVMPWSRFKFFGYVMGRSYPSPEVGHKVIYDDRLERYIPMPLPRKFHDCFRPRFRL